MGVAVGGFYTLFIQKYLLPTLLAVNLKSVLFSIIMFKRDDESLVFVSPYVCMYVYAIAVGKWNHYITKESNFYPV